MDVDFTERDYGTLHSKIRSFIKKAGREIWGSSFRGPSPFALAMVDQLTAEVTQNNLKIKTAAQLEKYFSQAYIMVAFVGPNAAVKWYPNLSPPSSKKYFVDFTRFWDLQEIKSEILEFIEMLGKESFENYHHASEPVLNGIDRLLDKELYGRECGGQMVRSPSDLDDFFTQRYIKDGFRNYNDQIKWMNGVYPNGKKSAIGGMDGETFLDFTREDLRVLKLQMDQFLTRIGRSHFRDNYNVSKTLMKQVDRLFNRRFYGKTTEHNITGPEDLDLFFSQKFVRDGFRQYQHLIKWAEPLRDPPKRVYRRYFEAALVRPPFRRVPVYKNPMVTKESWLMDPKKRKKTLQEELYWQVINIPAPIRSPMEFMPTVFAQKSVAGNTTTWWMCNLSNDISQVFSSTSSRDQLPGWINDAWEYINFRGRTVGHRTFLNDPSHSQFEEGEFLNAKYTVYCLVINVLDFERWHVWNCACKGTGDCGRGPCPFQVYVGKATKGLLDRWYYQSYGHTRVTKRLYECMKQLRENQVPFKMYEPENEKAQLPQCMLSLTKASYYPSALFVLKSCNNGDHMDNFEKMVIKRTCATQMSKGLNIKPK